MKYPDGHRADSRVGGGGDDLLAFLGRWRVPLLFCVQFWLLWCVVDVVRFFFSSSSTFAAGRGGGTSLFPFLSSLAIRFNLCTSSRGTTILLRSSRSPRLYKTKHHDNRRVDAQPADDAGRRRPSLVAGRESGFGRRRCFSVRKTRSCDGSFRRTTTKATTSRTFQNGKTQQTHAKTKLQGNECKDEPTSAVQRNPSLEQHAAGTDSRDLAPTRRNFGNQKGLH